MAQFDQAKAANQLPSLDSLAGGFSEESDRANLSYTESYSVVNFLIQTYGRDKMTTLLIALRDGATIDAALQSAYSLDTNGLEDAWRTSIGASPRIGTSNPTPIPTATQVPTFVPVGAAPVVPFATTTRPTQVQATTIPLVTPQASEPAATAVPLTERLGISHDVTMGIEFALVGCILAVLVIAIPILVTTRRHSRRQK